MEISLNQHKSIFRILKEAVVLYAKNFLPYTKAMIFPILAHLIGIPYIILVAYTLPDFLVGRFPYQSTFLLLIVVLIATAPGFLLFLKGFWAYLVAMVSLNNFTEGLISKDSDVTLKSCNEYVGHIKSTYMYVLLIMMLLWIAAIVVPYLPAILGFILPFWVVLILMIAVGFVSLLMVLCLSVYFSLGFQVLAFEDPKVFDVFKRSIILVEKNFFRTLILLVILYIITGIICPLTMHILCDITGIVSLLAHSINWASQMFVTQIELSVIHYPNPIFDTLNSLLMLMKDPAMEISKAIIVASIDATVTAGMLPLGTICFTLLYFDIKNKKEPQD